MDVKLNKVFGANKNGFMKKLDTREFSILYTIYKNENL